MDEKEKTDPVKKKKVYNRVTATKENGKWSGGKPLLELDEEQILELAKIQCTYSEIAAVMKCSPDTIADRYSEIVKRGREEGKASLRRHQYLAAARGNPALLIWLGKHILDQKDDSYNRPTVEGDVRLLLQKLQAIQPPAAEQIDKNTITIEENRNAVD